MLLSLLAWLGNHAGPVLAFAAGMFAVLKPGLIIRAVLHIRDTYRQASIGRREERLAAATQDMLNRLAEEVKGYQGAAQRIRERLDMAEDKLALCERRDLARKAEVDSLQETVLELQREKSAIAARVESIELACPNCPNRERVDASE